MLGPCYAKFEEVFRVYKKTVTLMFFPCLCSSLCQQQQWDLGLGCVRLPLILLAIIHGHLSLFTYSCKPKDDNPSGDSEDYSDHFFFQWSKEGAMNYVLFTASGGVFDIFIGLLQRSKFVFLIPLRTCTMRRMQFTHLCLVLNS